MIVVGWGVPQACQGSGGGGGGEGGGGGGGRRRKWGEGAGGGGEGLNLFVVDLEVGIEVMKCRAGIQMRYK